MNDQEGNDSPMSMDAYRALTAPLPEPGFVAWPDHERHSPPGLERLAPEAFIR